MPAAKSAKKAAPAASPAKKAAASPAKKAAIKRASPAKKIAKKSVRIQFCENFRGTGLPWTPGTQLLLTP
jgi:hypothetical protein